MNAMMRSSLLFAVLPLIIGCESTDGRAAHGISERTVAEEDAHSGPQVANPSGALALTGVTLIDPGRGVRAPGRTVLVTGERIEAVFPTGERALPAGTEVLNFEDHYLMPGLVEAHTHMMRRFRVSREAMYEELERMLLGGVVAMRDMAGDARILAEAGRSILVTERKGPDIYNVAVFGGPEFAAADNRMSRASLGLVPGEAPWAQAVTAETELPLAVARAVGSQVRALKLYLGLDAHLIESLVEEAHQQGLEVWAHAVVYPTRPLEVVRAGVDGVSHACGLAWQDTDLDPSPYGGASVGDRPRFNPAVVEAGSPEMKSLLEEMARRGTVFDPTLSAHSQPGDDAFGCTTELMVALTRAAHEAGVLLATGTDWFLPPEDPFPTVHREIQELVDRGVLTSSEALVAATLNGARALGREQDYGTVEPGKLASLVLLEADPTEDVAALRTIVAVVHRGTVHRRQTGGE